MIKLSYALRCKPSWWTKYKDHHIRAKWREEALAQEMFGGNLTESEVDYVLDELAGYEGMRDELTGVEVRSGGQFTTQSLTPFHSSIAVRLSS